MPFKVAVVKVEDSSVGEDSSVCIYAYRHIVCIYVLLYMSKIYSADDSAAAAIIPSVSGRRVV